MSVQIEVALKKNFRYVSNLIPHAEKTWVGFEKNKNQICHIQIVIRNLIQVA